MERRIPTLDEFINESEKVIDDAQIHGDKIVFGFNYELINDNGKLCVHISPGTGAREYFNYTGISLKKWDKDTMEDIVDALNGMSYGADGVSGAISRPVDKNDMKKFAALISKSLNESEQFEIVNEAKFHTPDEIVQGEGTSAYGIERIYGYAKDDKTVKSGYADLNTPDPNREFYKKGEPMITTGDFRLANYEGKQNVTEIAAYIVKQTKAHFNVYKHAFPGNDALKCVRSLVSCALTAGRNKKDAFKAIDALIEKWKNK
jgi:hypothetical protein